MAAFSLSRDYGLGLALRGHEAAARTFAESFAAGRLAHAWLISGPRGIGKATLTYRFARHVLASAGPNEGSLFGEAGVPAGAAAGTGDPLEMSSENHVFRRVASRGHSDFMALELEFDEKLKRMRKEAASKPRVDQNGADRDRADSP